MRSAAKKEFNIVSKRCPRLKILLEEQRADGLSKKEWLAVMCLFINAGRISLAREFSAESVKHDCASDETIDDLSIARSVKKTYCVYLGCDETDIKNCFTKCRLSEKTGKFINSPKSKMKLTQEEKEAIGFLYDYNEKTRQCSFDNINENIYAKHILENYRLMIHDTGKFYMYHGRYWRELRETRKIGVLEQILKHFFDKFEPGKWNKNFERHYIDVLTRDCKRWDQFESPENYINVRNGLLYLEDEVMELRGHNMNIFTTVQVPIDYDTKAKCPAFKDFLRTIFQGDDELIRLVVEIMGYCLSFRVKASKMFFFIGGGSNGKSTLFKLFYDLVGGVNNVSSVEFKSLNNKFASSQIVGKTVNISPDDKITSNIDTHRIKAIVAGDPIQIETKHQNPVSYKSFVKLIFGMNDMPETLDKSHGFDRRIISIPFNVRFVEGTPTDENEIQADLDMPEKLHAELPGIFALAIKGLKRLMKNNYRFSESAKSSAMLEEIKEVNNPYLEFVRRYIKADEKAVKIEDTQLNMYFIEWCSKEGHKFLMQENKRKMKEGLRKALKENGINFNELHSGNTYYWKGFVCKWRIQ
jgi:putative DNA primase/helicase